MGSPNGGIIGVVNPTSFGKCTVTSVTASTPAFAQPGTRLASVAVVAGGGGGGSGIGGFSGGGAGGLKNLRIIFSLWSNTISNYNWRFRWSSKVQN
jgi:hypothetical protein